MFCGDVLEFRTLNLGQENPIGCCHRFLCTRARVANPVSILFTRYWNMSAFCNLWEFHFLTQSTSSAPVASFAHSVWTPFLCFLCSLL